MDISPNKKKKKPPNKTTAFLCCFGFSGHRDNLSSASAAKKRRRWFLLSICGKKKSAAKTVPLVDAATAAAPPDEKVNRSREIHVVKSDSKKTSSKSRQSLPPPAELVSGEVVHYKTTKYDKTESFILDKSKSLDHHLNPVEYSTKKVSKKNSSAAGATDDRTTELSLTGKKKKSYTVAARRGGADSEHNNRETSNVQNNNIGSSTTRDQDFTYGMSILLVILIIMLFWGKLCAILCTAACFYFAPGISRTNKEPEIAPENSRVTDNVRFSSEERKKKVVLDGFLERNHVRH